MFLNFKPFLLVERNFELHVVGCAPVRTGQWSSEPCVVVKNVAAG